MPLWQREEVQKMLREVMVPAIRRAPDKLLTVFLYFVLLSLSVYVVPLLYSICVE